MSPPRGPERAAPRRADGRRGWTFRAGSRYRRPETAGVGKPQRQERLAAACPLPGYAEHRSPVRTALFRGLVLSTLLTAGYAWVSFDKTVQVEIDGRPRAVRTFAGTVGGVLDQIHVETGAHDLV